ncbi:MAG: hypothetical protein JW881_11660 [Spirochaetales bacterium]|nr:hypothetical protein [Spirochaetales bacterium]
MGLYAKAIILHRQHDKKKGLFQRALEYQRQDLINHQRKTGTDIDDISGLYDEINQQINICKANNLPLAVIGISLKPVVDAMLTINNKLERENIVRTLVPFLEKLLSDESKLTPYGNDFYIFSIFNPDTVYPQLVCHQMSRSLCHYSRDLKETASITFNRKIRYFPEHGENADQLLRSIL